MGESNSRNFDIIIKTKFDGTGASAATSSMGNLRKQLALPEVGPLTREQSQVEQLATTRVRAMEKAAERSRVGEIVNDRLFGGADTARRRDLTLEDFGRGSASRMPTVARGKSISQQGEEIQKAMRGFGALAIANQVGASLQRIPDAADKFRENLKLGYTRTEAFTTALSDVLPGVGELAKGFRAVGDELFDAANTRFTKSEDARKKAMAEDIDRGDVRARRQSGALKDFTDRAIPERDSLRLIGTEGDVRARTEARIKYDQQLRTIKDEVSKAREEKLTPEQTGELDRVAEERRNAARMEFEGQGREIDAKRNRKLSDDAEAVAKFDEEAQANILKAKQEARRIDLEESGRFLQSRKEAIQAAADDEIKSLEKVRDAERDALKERQSLGKDIESDVGDDPDVRFARKRAAVLALAKRRAAGEDVALDRSLDETRGGIQREDLSAAGSLAERKLRLSGQFDDADKLGIKAKLTDAILAAGADYAKSRLNADEEPLARERRDKRIAAAQLEAQVSDEERKAKRETMFRPDGPAAFAGDTHLLRGVTSQTANERQTVALAERQAKATEETNKLIKSLVAAITNNPGLQGANIGGDNP